MRGHLISREQIDALYAIADHLWALGAEDAAYVVGGSAYDLHCGAGELRCIVDLFDHPKRNKAEIKEWLADMIRLQWTEDDRGLVCDWRAPKPLSEHVNERLQDVVVNERLL